MRHMLSAVVGILCIACSANADTFERQIFQASQKASSTIHENHPTTTPAAPQEITAADAHQRAFITSKPIQARMVGLAGADEFCRQSAQTAGLKGSWRAILSDGDNSATDYYAHRMVDYSARGRIVIDGPVYDMNGTLIADDKDNFWKGALHAPISRDEFNKNVLGDYPDYGNGRPLPIWTGTAAGAATDYNCENWDLTPGNESMQATVGTVSTGANWLANDLVPCGGKYPLYCIDGQNDDKPNIVVTGMDYQPDTIPDSNYYVEITYKNVGRGIGRGWLTFDYKSQNGETQDNDYYPTQVPLLGETASVGFQPWNACLEPGKSQPLTVVVHYHDLTDNSDVTFPPVTMTVRTPKAYPGITPTNCFTRQ